MTLKQHQRGMHGPGWTAPCGDNKKSECIHQTSKGMQKVHEDVGWCQNEQIFFPKTCGFQHQMWTWLRECYHLSIWRSPLTWCRFSVCQTGSIIHQDWLLCYFLFQTSNHLVCIAYLDFKINFSRHYLDVCTILTVTVVTLIFVLTKQ